MKRVFALTGIISLLMPTITYAATSSVSVQSNVEASSNSDITTTGQSHVRIETNGEVREFNTSGNESVDWKSEDGKSSVRINNGGTSVHTEEPSVSTTDSDDTKTKEPTATTPTKAAEKQEEQKMEVKTEVDIPTNPVSMIVVIIKGLISLF